MRWRSRKLAPDSVNLLGVVYRWRLRISASTFTYVLSLECLKRVVLRLQSNGRFEAPDVKASWVKCQKLYLCRTVWRRRRDKAAHRNGFELHLSVSFYSRPIYDFFLNQLVVIIVNVRFAIGLRQYINAQIYNFNKFVSIYYFKQLCFICT